MRKIFVILLPTFGPKIQNKNGPKVWTQNLNQKFDQNLYKRDPDSGKNKKVYHTFEDKADTFPYLLVNIGSGVSIICIKNETEWERVGGTAMGGGTFWGLGIW